MSESNQIRLVLDTNILVSFLFQKSLSKLEDLVTSNNFLLLTSADQIEELLDVIRRPKIAAKVPKSKIIEVIDFLLDYFKIVDTSLTHDFFKDPNDNFLIDLCVEGEVDFLVSGDAGVLEKKEYKGTRIVSVREFITQFERLL